MSYHNVNPPVLNHLFISMLFDFTGIYRNGFFFIIILIKIRNILIHLIYTSNFDESFFFFLLVSLR